MPDNYNIATSPLTSKSLDSAQWATLEKAGAVFLPMGGYRLGIHVYNEAYTTYPHCGFYWTSTGGVSRIHLVNDKTEIAGTTRKTGCSVRLVQEIIKEALVTVEFPKPGESVSSNNHYDANIVGKVTLPEDAKFTVYEMRYYSKDGNTFPERQFNANTEYKLLIQLKANGTYTFPLLSDGYIDRKAVTAKINDQVITTSNMNVGNKYLTLTIIFTTADDASFVSSPTFSNNASYIVGSAKIGLTCGTAGASIYYTTDGTTPNATNGTLYSDSILVNVDKENDNTQFVIKAVAIKGEISSEVVTKSYKLSRPTYPIMPQTAENGTFTVSLDRAKEDDTITIHATPNTGYIVDKYVIEGVEQDDSTPSIQPTRDSIIDQAQVTITCATEDATIYYTTNCTTPTDESTRYEGSFTITVDEHNNGTTLTIKAIAYYSGKSSDVATKSYILDRSDKTALQQPTLQNTGTKKVIILKMRRGIFL